MITLQGPNIDDQDLKGIIPRITEQIFASIMASPANLEYLVKVSYMEIYMERIRDLLFRERCLDTHIESRYAANSSWKQRPTIIYRFTKIKREEFMSRICPITTWGTPMKSTRL